VTQATDAVSSRRRLLAVVSLVASAGLVLAVIGFLYRKGANLVLGLLGLCIAIIGAWTVLTEVRTRRVVGAAGVAIGIALIAAGFVRAVDDFDQFLVRTVIAVVLLAVAFGCARAAMLREPRTNRVQVGAGVQPAHPVLLCNPWSGGGKVARFGLAHLAAELGVETVMLDRGSTSSASREKPWREAQTAWAWPGATARRHWSHRSPSSTGFRSCA
jgi:hypothetical protein